jgi:pimeloyl-ACP methyl ester carboxylesterase
MFATSRGYRIHYQPFGNGPAIVLLHGGAALANAAGEFPATIEEYFADWPPQVAASLSPTTTSPP